MAIATENNQQEIIDFLMESDDSNVSPELLFQAIKDGNVQLVKKLLDKEIDPNSEVDFLLTMTMERHQFMSLLEEIKKILLDYLLIMELMLTGKLIYFL